MENKIAPFSYSGSSADVVGIKKSQGDSSCSGVVSSSLFSDQLYKSTRNIMQQRQDMVNREALCYTRLHEASLEAEALRLENTELRSMNRHLKTELNSLIRSSIQNRFDLRSPLRMLSNLSIGGNDADEVENQNQNRTVNRDDVSDESPTSVMENEDLNRSSLPKSISVRSSGYSKASQGGGGAAAQSGKPRGTVTKPGTCGQVSTTVYLFFVFLIT